MTKQREPASSRILLINVRLPGVIFLSVFIVVGRRTMRNQRQTNDSQIRVIGRDPYSARGDIRCPGALTLHPYVQHVIIRGNVRNVETSFQPPPRYKRE